MSKKEENMKYCPMAMSDCFKDKCAIWNQINYECAFLSIANELRWKRLVSKN